DCWRCNAPVIAQPANFIHGNPPFLFVDIIHPTIEDPISKQLTPISLKFHNIQRCVVIGSFS
ncbi:unnamed protein product, partial [Rotaria sp. Silwood1]